MRESIISISIFFLFSILLIAPALLRPNIVGSDPKESMPLRVSIKWKLRDANLTWHPYPEENLSHFCQQLRVLKLNGKTYLTAIFEFEDQLVVVDAETGEILGNVSVPYYKYSNADIDGDGDFEMVLNNPPNTTCYEIMVGEKIQLEEKWARRTGEIGQDYYIFEDLTGDGYLDIIIDDFAEILALDGKNGSELWRASNYTEPINISYVYSCLAGISIGDLNRDGYPDIFTGAAITDDQPAIIAINGKNGSLLWAVNTTSLFETYVFMAKTSCMGDVDNNGNLEAIWCVPDIVLLNHSGGIIGTYITPDSGLYEYFRRALADINMDGRPELIESLGSIYIFDPASLSLIGTIPYPPIGPGYVSCVGDMDGDGDQELIVHTYYFDRYGNVAREGVSIVDVVIENDSIVDYSVLWNYTIYDDPAPPIGLFESFLVDVDGNGDLEIISSTMRWLICFDVEPSSSISEWYYRQGDFLYRCRWISGLSEPSTNVTVTVTDTTTIVVSTTFTDTVISTVYRTVTGWVCSNTVVYVVGVVVVGLILLYFLRRFFRGRG